MGYSKWLDAMSTDEMCIWYLSMKLHIILPDGLFFFSTCTLSRVLVRVSTPSKDQPFCNIVRPFRSHLTPRSKESISLSPPYLPQSPSQKTQLPYRALPNPTISFASRPSPPINKSHIYDPRLAPSAVHSLALLNRRTCLPYPHPAQTKPTDRPTE